MAKQIILRYPGGKSTLEYNENNTSDVQKFIKWVIKHNHYSDYDDQNYIFSFEDYKFVSLCKIKWRKLGLRCS